MKAYVTITISAEIGVDTQAELDEAMATLGGRAHRVLDGGLDEADILDWDFNTDYSLNYGEGVSLIEKQAEDTLQTWDTWVLRNSNKTSSDIFAAIQKTPERFVVLTPAERPYGPDGVFGGNEAALAMAKLNKCSSRRQVEAILSQHLYKFLSAERMA